MFVKRSGSIIFGAKLTSAEQKALDIEIKRQLEEYDIEHRKELISCILWVLHRKFGFGYTRLKRFYDLFDDEFAALLARYEMEDDDQIWLCTHLLKKECGVNIDEWDREIDKKYRSR